MTKTFLIFIDGIGIGKPDKVNNPFFKHEWKLFSQYFDEPPSVEQKELRKENAVLFPVDAVMGVEGLPQSGTGQTSIFCGVNAQKMIGKHFGPFPYSTLVPTIKEKNIFRAFKEKGLLPVFANAYPKVFFDYIDSGKKRLSVTSLSCMLSDVKLKMEEDLRNSEALSAEIDNARWVKKLNYDLPIIEPEDAAKTLLKLSESHDLTVFEYFLTDHFGHGRIKDLEHYVVSRLDRFLYHIFTNISEEHSLVICSDHGNFEDTGIKSHTMNKAIAITAGKNHIKIRDRINCLKDIKGAILEYNT